MRELGGEEGDATRLLNRLVVYPFLGAFYLAKLPSIFISDGERGYFILFSRPSLALIPFNILFYSFVQFNSVQFISVALISSSSFSFKIAI